MALTIHQVAIGGLDDNFSYVIADTDTKDAFIIDPSGDFVKVAVLVAANNFVVRGTLLTHTHQDHYDQLGAALHEFPGPIYVHTLGVTTVQKYGDVHALKDNLELPLGNGSIQVLHTPGHIDDAVCFFIPADQAEDAVPKVITGDTLFVGGCGRTNEQGVKDLYESLAELANLPDDTIVFPGHDYGDTPTSTIGDEKQTNRFYQAKNFTEFVQLRLG